jgi:small subunit ribosomal protein S16
MTGQPLDIEGLTIVDNPNMPDGENGASIEEMA